MHRGHAILAVLVAGAALWAYLVAHPLSGGAPAGPGSVSVWQVPQRDVTAVTYRDGPRQVRLQPNWQPGASKPTVWVRTGSVAAVTGQANAPATTKEAGKAAPKTAPTGSKAAKSARPGARKGAHAPPAPPRQQDFRGNATAQQLFARLASLAAERDLGPLAGLDAKEFGFPAKAATLELTRQGAPSLKLELGRTTYGDTGRYAHDPANGHVYLLPRAALRPFAIAANSLMDRDLLALQPEHAQRMEVRIGARSRTFYHLSGPGRWGPTRQATTDEPDAGALAADLQRLRVLRYRPKGEAVPVGPPELEVRLFAASGETPSEASLRIYASQDHVALAVSSYTERPVELPASFVTPLLEKARSLLHGT